MIFSKEGGVAMITRNSLGGRHLSLADSFIDEVERAQEQCVHCFRVVRGEKIRGVASIPYLFFAPDKFVMRCRCGVSRVVSGTEYCGFCGSFLGGEIVTYILGMICGTKESKEVFARECKECGVEFVWEKLE